MLWTSAFGALVYILQLSSYFHIQKHVLRFEPSSWSGKQYKLTTSNIVYAFLRCCLKNLYQSYQPSSLASRLSQPSGHKCATHKLYQYCTAHRSSCRWPLRTCSESSRLSRSLVSPKVRIAIFVKKHYPDFFIMWQINNIVDYSVWRFNGLVQNWFSTPS